MTSPNTWRSLTVMLVGVGLCFFAVQAVADTLGLCLPNQIVAGPTNGIAAYPKCRTLTSTDLPNNTVLQGKVQVTGNTVSSNILENIPGGQFTAAYLATISRFLGAANTADGTQGLGVVGTTLQNGVGGTNFPVGVTGYGKLDFLGYQAYGLNGVCDQLTAGVCSNEFDVNNFSGPPLASYPPAYPQPTTSTLPQALYLGCGGTFPCYAGLMIGANGFSPSTFQAGIYEFPPISPTAGLYGMFSDADASHSYQYNAFLRNTGLGPNINVVLQTTGTFTPSNKVFGAIDSSGGAHYSLYQDGHQVGLGLSTDINGHATLGAGGSAPALSTCGTSPMLSGSATDTQGSVTPGTGVTACTLTFATAFGASPICHLTGTSANTPFLSAVSVSAITVTAPTNLAPFSYLCLKAV